MTRNDDKDDPGDSWVRRANESAPAYDALVAFLEMGADRSLRKLAKQLRKSLSLLGRWSATHDWVERVRAREEHERREVAGEDREHWAEARRRREANAEQLERVAMAGLRSLLVRDPDSGETRFDRRLKPAEIASLIRVACHLLPTPPPEPPEEDGEENPLADLDEDELRRLREKLSEKEDDDEQAET